MFDKIVHASDGSKYAFLALTWALALAKQNNSELHIVCVEEVPYLPDSSEKSARRSIQQGNASRAFSSRPALLPKNIR